MWLRTVYSYQLLYVYEFERRQRNFKQIARMNKDDYLIIADNDGCLEDRPNHPKKSIAMTAPRLLERRAACREATDFSLKKFEA